MIPRRLRVPGLAIVGGIVTFALLAHWGHGLRAPFINDDYVFLDRTRDAPFLGLWGVDALLFGWWRPLSRDLHYWWLQRAFGPNELVFHLVSVALAIATLVAYFAVARRIAGTRQAAVATAGVAALSAWAVPMLWIAGVQETWMLLFATLALHAFLAGRMWWSALAYAAALLSKETAAVVPAIAFLGAVLVNVETVRAAFGRVLPLAAITAGWAWLHPALRGAGVADAGGSIGMTERVLRTLGTPLNLDHLPDPTAGIGDLVVRVLPAFAALVALIAWGESRRVVREPRAPRPWVAVFGLLWALLGWAPALWPDVGWHAYYTLFGAFGAWLAFAVVLGRRPVLAGAVIGALCVLRVLQAATPSLDWGSEWYQNRSAMFLRFLRDDLRRVVPAPAAGTRFFFTGVPSNVGFLTEGGPALRVWYADTTLSGGFLSDYAPRPPGARPGADRFFRYDSTTGWIDMAAGDSGGAFADPRAFADRRVLAAALARAGDWSAAANTLAELARRDPGSLELAADAAVSFAMAGDSAAAARWFTVAARHPAADDTLKRWARAFAHHLSSRP